MTTNSNGLRIPTSEPKHPKCDHIVTNFPRAQARPHRRDRYSRRVGRWGTLSLLETDDVGAATRELITFFESEGWDVAPVAPRKRTKNDPMRYGTGASSRAWAVAIGPGARGFTTIATAPFGLLAEPCLNGAAGLRLARLSSAVGCHGLHVSLQDGVALAVLETSKEGTTRVSGCTMEGPTFQGLEVPEDQWNASIRWNDVPRSVHAALERSSEEGFDAILESIAGGAAWATCGQDLLGGRSVQIEGATTLCFVRREAEVRPAGELSLCVRVEKHPLSKRIVLDDCVWIDDDGIEAADPKRGDAFLRKLAHFLHTSVPAGAHGVPIRAFCSFEPPELAVGDHLEVQLGLAIEGDRASLRERDPGLRRSIVEHLAPALRGTRAHPDAAFDGFERLTTEPTVLSLGAFAGERAVAAIWRKRRTAIFVDGVEVAEVPGIATALGAASRWLAVSVAEPASSGRSQGYGQDSPSRLLLFAIEDLVGAKRKPKPRELLASDASLTFGFTALAFSDDERAIRMRVNRKRKAGFLTLDLATGQHKHTSQDLFDDPGLRERAARFEHAPWHRFGHPPMRVGTRGLVVGGEPCLELDLETGSTRPLLGPAGLEPVAISASGARCIASIGERRLFVAERTHGG